MIEVDSIEEELYVDLAADDYFDDSAVEGYRVENWGGLDFAVLAYPEDYSLTLGGANPAHFMYFDDGEYRADVIFSPKPITWEDTFDFNDQDIEVGIQAESSSDGYVELSPRRELSHIIRDKLRERDDVEESAAETVKEYVIQKATAPVGNQHWANVFAILNGEQTISEEEHVRVQKLANHFL